MSPGQQESAVGLDRAIDALGREYRANRDNAAVTHQDVTCDHLEGVVHGDDARAADS